MGIVTGGKIPTAVKSLLQDGKGNVKTTMFDEARARAEESHTDLEDDEDFHEFVTHRKRWLKAYKDDFEEKFDHLTDHSALRKNIALMDDKGRSRKFHGVNTAAAVPRHEMARTWIAA